MIRLGLSLASAARGSDLPGVTTARILEELVAGYQEALTTNLKSAKDKSHRPKRIQALLAQSLSDDGSWKPPPASTGEITGVPLSRDQLEYLADTRAQQIEELQSENERLLDWSNGSDTNGANVALSSLARIVGDNGATVRQRIRASAAVLGYKTEGDIANFVKRYLTSVCESNDIAIDYKIEAGELLRRHESPRIAPETVRPAYRDETPREPPEPIMQLVARRKERQERREREAIERLEREAIPSERGMLLALLAGRNGDGSDDTPDS